eukprot:CAMPEP_0203902332 /NCGR_PEP_ID=MMETSP0359-20131031/44405_1 /ASSEMBLY_ACC=CAM_ASM_000338 /TAXON_ID=268821 /ORGANISM="Scrippsiella Hangoei, Strain SHTV-5" /LENGTH=465 /DNA_ID=CAMNT_0050826161 /DNA_START=26 /DNA_END=1421 /DNA_ORIENTATION=+
MAASVAVEGDAVAEPVIMTVLGPVPPADVSAVSGPALCREWLVNDQKDLLQQATATSGAKQEDGTVGLVELASVMRSRRWPLASLHNLHLSHEDVLAELAGPLKRRALGARSCLVVASTPRAFWNPVSSSDYSSRLRALAREVGDTLVLVVGTAPAPGQLAGEEGLAAEVSRLVSDLRVGFEGSADTEGGEKVRPGFIGELQLWDPLTGPPAPHERLALLACAEAQHASGAALVLSGAVSEDVMAVLSEGGADLTRCAFFDVPPTSPVSAARLVDAGAFLGFCPPGGSADVAWQDYPGRRPWRTEEAFVDALSSGPSGRTLLGSGLRFRTDLSAFGGPGICYAPDLLAAVSAGVGLGPAIPPCSHDLRQAAVNFLQYAWKPPPPPEKIIQRSSAIGAALGNPKGIISASSPSTIVPRSACRTIGKQLMSLIRTGVELPSSCMVGGLLGLRAEGGRRSTARFAKCS